MILGSGLIQASGKTRLTLYTTKSGTFNPTIVASDTSGIIWDFGDGSATYTGGTPSHSYADGTQKTVTITFDDPTLVTQLNFQNQSMKGEWPMSSLADFTALTQLRAYNDTMLNISGDVSEIPSSLQILQCFNNASTISGQFSDFPVSMTTIYLNDTSCSITGAMPDLPASLQNLYFYRSNCVLSGNLADAPASLRTVLVHDTSSNIGGGATAMAAVGIQQIRVDSSSTTQGNIDDILLRLYTDRASFTWATPTLNVGSTNPDPSGVYQDATPPTTGLEYAYKLVVDPDTEGFNTWTVTY